MKFVLEKNSENIEFDVNNIKIVVNECNENQIKLYKKNKISYCESPICRESCPIMESRAICKPSKDSRINDYRKNICECSPGWEGDMCDEKVFVNYK